MLVPLRINPNPQDNLIHALLQDSLVLVMEVVNNNALKRDRALAGVELPCRCHF